MQCGTLTVPLDHHFHTTILVHTTGSSTLADFNEPAWKRLVTRAFLPHEVASLIESILRSEDEIKMIGNLYGDDAQTFIDMIHEVPSTLPFPGHGLITFVHHFGSTLSNFHFPLDQALNLPDFPPHLQGKCLRVLCRICGRRGLLPRSLQIPLSYNRSDTPLYRGGYADVWKGAHQGSHVAVKVLRVYSTSDFDKITTVSSHSLVGRVPRLAVADPSRDSAKKS